jgi:hypothetical protein
MMKYGLMLFAITGLIAQPLVTSDDIRNIALGAGATVCLFQGFKNCRQFSYYNQVYKRAKADESSTFEKQQQLFLTASQAGAAWIEAGDIVFRDKDQAAEFKSREDRLKALGSRVNHNGELRSLYAVCTVACGAAGGYLLSFVG